MARRADQPAGGADHCVVSLILMRGIRESARVNNVIVVVKVAVILVFIAIGLGLTSTGESHAAHPAE